MQPIVDICLDLVNMLAHLRTWDRSASFSGSRGQRDISCSLSAYWCVFPCVYVDV